MNSNSDGLARRDAADVLSKTVLDNDLGKLAPRERTEYYFSICKSLNLNPLTRPFELIRLNGRLTLYATKSCTDQLRQIYQVTIDNLESQVVGETFSVSLRATLPNGRQDMDLAAVSIKGLQGEALCNAMMKCITKAKRRVTLSICGLGGFMDELEAQTVKHAEFVEEPADVSDGQIWRSWQHPDDAIAWAETVLPDFSVEQLKDMFEKTAPRGGKKAEAWCERVLSLADFSF